MSAGKGKRFRVLARDLFTCQYCGRRAPDVVLEVDHVVPRSHGGSDHMSNLVASCWECNIGKSAEMDTKQHVAEVWLDRDMLAEVLELQRRLKEAQDKIYALVRQIELADEPKGTLTSVADILRELTR